MRVVFMGTPAFAVPSLAALLAAGYDVAAVYSQPPRPTGRGHKVQKSPIHTFADTHGLEVLTPVSFKSSEERAAFAALGADVGIVVAYGLILPMAILSAPTHGCLNLHGSLLPRWRGAAPIQRAIMAGDSLTGVQVMQMEKGLDTGPILLSETVPIAPNDTADSLGERLSHIGAELLPRALAALSRGGLVPQPQSEAGVTYAHKISAEDARIDWTQPAGHLGRHIRGLHSVPGAWCVLPTGKAEERVKVWAATPTDLMTDQSPGIIVAASGQGIDVACGGGTVLRLTRLQRAGKTVQEAEPFLRGTPITPGTRFG